MGKTQPRNVWLNRFYEDAYAIAGQQVFQLEQPRAVQCTIQAVRYLLRDYLHKYGQEVVLHIIASGGEQTYQGHSLMSHAKYL